MSTLQERKATRDRIYSIALEILEYASVADKMKNMMEYPRLLKLVAENIKLDELPTGVALDYLCELRQIHPAFKDCLDARITSDSRAYAAATKYDTLDFVGPSNGQHSELMSDYFRLARTLAYHAENKICFDIPEPLSQKLDPQGKQDAARLPMVAARMMWLEGRQVSVLPLYPKEGRYANLVLDKKKLSHTLSKHSRHQYLWYKQGCQVEWHTFLQLVAYITYFKHNLPKTVAHIEKMLDLRRRHSKITVPCPSLEVYTTPCTAEAAAEHDEHDSRCYSCHFKFADAFSDPDMTEPAVRTKCGHVHGAVCLKNWTKAGNIDCPKCRKDLFGFEIWMPEATRKPYDQMHQMLEKCAELDEEVDGYLFRGYRETHEVAFGKLLFKLADLAEKMAAVKIVFQTVAQTGAAW